MFKYKLTVKHRFNTLLFSIGHVQDEQMSRCVDLTFISVPFAASKPETIQFIFRLLKLQLLRAFLLKFTVQRSTNVRGVSRNDCNLGDSWIRLCYNEQNKRLPLVETKHVCGLWCTVFDRAIQLCLPYSLIDYVIIIFFGVHNKMLNAICPACHFLCVAID